MKKSIGSVLLLLCIIGFGLTTNSQTATAQSVNFQVFYDELSPHGRWVQTADYGYAWCPRTSGFSPYSTNGYWAPTEVGWTWVSDFSWGWAPFHYGRWYNDPFYGYMWVPGYEWGPGWVSWRRSGDYYGWAPLGPGIGINIGYSNSYQIPSQYWRFIRCQHLGRPDVNRYYLPASGNVTYVSNTTVITTTREDRVRGSFFTPGPDRQEVERMSGKKIIPLTIADAATPAQQVTKKSVRLYRPLISNDIQVQQNAAPSKFIATTEARKHDNHAETVKPMKQAPESETSDGRVLPTKQVPQQKLSAETVEPMKHPLRPETDDVRAAPLKEEPASQRDMQLSSNPVKQAPEVNTQVPVREPLTERRNVQAPLTQEETIREKPEPAIRRRPEQQKTVPTAPSGNIPAQQEVRTQQQPVRQAPEQPAMQRREPVQQERFQRSDVPKQNMPRMQRAPAQGSVSPQPARPMPQRRMPGRRPS